MKTLQLLKSMDCDFVKTLHIMISGSKNYVGRTRQQSMG